MGGMDGSSSRRNPAIAAIFAGACLAAATLVPSASAAPPAEPESSGRAIVEVSSPSVPAAADPGSPRWRRLRAEAGAVLTRIAGRNGLDVASRIPETGQLSVALGPGEDVADLRDRLAGDPRVTGVAADRAIEPRFSPNDPGFTAVDAIGANGDFRQWYLSRLFAPQAWDLSRGERTEVAVIDVGTDVTHPDLAGRIAGSIDCTGGCSGTNVASGDGHGTHVAGIACATTNNGYGIASAGFGCGLFPIRVDLCSDAAAAVVYAANRGSDVLNMSFGGPCSEMIQELQYALNAGSVLVAAGDNSANPNPNNNYPAQWIQPLGTGPQTTFNRGLVVTGAGHSGARIGWAQQDTGVSVAGFAGFSDAIGGQQGILSTWPNLGCSPGCRATVGGDSRFAYLQGTSMASPQVAGVAALMRSLNPSIPAPDVASVIKQTAGQTAGTCGAYGNGLGWGIVNAYRAVAAVAPGDINPPHSKAKRGRGKIRVKRGDDDETRLCTGAKVKASGVKKVLLFVSVNGGEYRKLGRVKGKSERFRGKAGKRYRFYSIAIDETGNREAAPAEADAKLNRKKKGRR